MSAFRHRHPDIRRPLLRDIRLPHHRGATHRHHRGIRRHRRRVPCKIEFRIPPSPQGSECPIIGADRVSKLVRHCVLATPLIKFIPQVPQGIITNNSA
jgi:hypothetical protein